MNAESEHFEALLKLMALKRHEQPSPVYFSRLRRQILLRLEDAEPAFLERLSELFVFRPAMAYALGLAFCGSIATGLVYALQLRPSDAMAQHNPAESLDALASSATAAGQNGSFTLQVPGYDRFAVTSTNEAHTSLFHPFDPQTLVPVSYGMGY